MLKSQRILYTLGNCFNLLGFIFLAISIIIGFTSLGQNIMEKIDIKLVQGIRKETVIGILVISISLLSLMQGWLFERAVENGRKVFAIFCLLLIEIAILIEVIALNGFQAIINLNIVSISCIIACVIATITLLTVIKVRLNVG